MNHKKIFVILGVAFFTIFLQTNALFAAIGAPTVVKQGYGLGARMQQGSDSFPGSWNKVHFDFTFMYEGDTSDLKAFRLYEKRPGMYGFNLAVEFSNLLNVTSSHSAVSGTWSISRLNTTWIISKRDQSLLTTEPVALYESVSAYPPGTYSYYVTAVDSYGNEGIPSQTYNLNVLGPIQILDPAQGSVVSLVPNLRWTVVDGWPDNQVLYIIKIHDGKSTIWSKTQINKIGELVYDGAPLDPAKQYTLNVQGHWTSDYFKSLATYFAGSSQDAAFQVSVSPPSPIPILLPVSQGIASLPTVPPSPPKSISPPITSKVVSIPKPKILESPKTPESKSVSQAITTMEQKNVPSTTQKVIPEKSVQPVPPSFFGRFGLALSRFFETLFGR